MIRNLATYNAWKRTTLDRLTSKYRMLFVAIFRKHLESMRTVMEEALEDGRTTLPVHLPDLDAHLARVLRAHQEHVIKVGVSDGMREVTPEKKFSTWEQWPYWYPVEDTFKTLAERGARDKIFNRIHKKVAKQAGGFLAQIIDLEKERYLRNLKSVFANAAKDFFKTEDTDDTKEVVKDVIARIFSKTDTQAEMIFRTETTRYFNEARLEYFKHETDVDFVQLVAVTDGRISEICEVRDGYVIPIDQANQKKFKPPFHPNCRTVQSPLDTDLKSDAKEVESNLGSEFGKVHSDTSDKDFTGRRAPPSIQLPPGWG